MIKSLNKNLERATLSHNYVHPLPFSIHISGNHNHVSRFPSLILIRNSVEY